MKIMAIIATGPAILRKMPTVFSRNHEPATEIRMSDNKTPTHIAYALSRRGRASRWLEVGVAAPHGDGQGFDILLDRMPVGGFSGHVLIRAAGTKPPAPPSPLSEEDA